MRGNVRSAENLGHTHLPCHTLNTKQQRKRSCNMPPTPKRLKPKQLNSLQSLYATESPYSSAHNARSSCQTTDIYQDPNLFLGDLCRGYTHCEHG